MTTLNYQKAFDIGKYANHLLPDLTDRINVWNELKSGNFVEPVIVDNIMCFKITMNGVQFVMEYEKLKNESVILGRNKKYFHTSIAFAAAFSIATLVIQIKGLCIQGEELLLKKQELLNKQCIKSKSLVNAKKKDLLNNQYPKHLPDSHNTDSTKP